RRPDGSSRTGSTRFSKSPAAPRAARSRRTSIPCACPASRSSETISHTSSIDWKRTVTSPPVADPPTSGRLASLDAFRGLTVAAMLLVNNPGSWSHIYPPLRHAAWHGWTPTDLIFPFFLFIVGVTTHLSLSRRRVRGVTDSGLAAQVLRRGGIIILLGLLLSAFPFFPLERLTEIRIPGVLQRIGLVYLVTGLLTLKTTARSEIVIATVILAGYNVLLAVVPVPGVGHPAIAPPDSTMAAWLDRRVLDGHLWAVTRTWDPEGLLPTVPAVATCLLGVVAGRWITRTEPLSRRVRGLFAAGGLGLAAGWAWNAVLPINKNLWTSSYVVFTAGMACVVLAACMWLVDQRGVRWWTRPFVVYGVN